MLESAQRMSAYADSRTTSLYDRRAGRLSRAKLSGFDLIDGAFAPKPEWRVDRVWPAKKWRRIRTGGAEALNGRMVSSVLSLG